MPNLRPKGKSNAELLAIKKEVLILLETQSKIDHIDLFYGDETGISELAYVSYCWQKRGENLAISASDGKQINCFGILSRDNKLFFKTTIGSINADFIVGFFEEFSFKISKQTVVVLDSARIHIAQKVKERFKYWQDRGGSLYFICHLILHT